MALVCIPFAGFQLQWNDQILSPLVITARDLDCGIDVSLESIHWRPYMFLNLKQFVNAQVEFCAVAILHGRIGLLVRLVQHSIIYSMSDLPADSHAEKSLPKLELLESSP